MEKWIGLKMKSNPGSRKAKIEGCTCPDIDNGYGGGYMGGRRNKDGEIMFVIVLTCPLHGEDKNWIIKKPTL